MYRRATRIVVCTLSIGALAVACGGEKSDNKQSGDKSGGGAKVAKKPLTELFASKSVTLVGPLAKLSFGMSKADAEKAAPELFKSSMGLESEEFEGVMFSPYIDRDKDALTGVSVFLPKGAGEAEITGAWGPGVKVEVSSRGESLVWWNKEAKLRAALFENTLSIKPYLPLGEFLGEGAQGFGFEKPQSVIGATPEQLTKAYGKKFDNANDTIAYIEMPPLKYGRSKTRVSLTKREGKVARMQIWIPFGPDKDAIKAAVEKKFGGPAKEVEEGVAPYTKKRQMLSDMVEIKEQKGRWYLEVAAPKAKK